MKHYLKPSVVVPLLAMLALVALPVVATMADQTFYIALFSRLLIYAVAASALNLALGYGGLIGFGHALFIGLGAYSVSMLSYNGIGNGWLHVLLAIVVCALAGLVSGIISLRTKGIAFIMITLAFSQIGYFIFVSLKQYGGDDGMSIDHTSRFGSIDLGNTLPLYVVTLGVLAVLILWLSRVRTAPFGMVLRAGRQNARRVNAIGMPLLRYQLLAYVISAAVCGIAGLLLADLNAFASPGLMSWQVSGELIVMVVIGGLGYAFGPLFGAMVFIGLDEIMKHYTEHWMFIFGPLLVVMAITGKAGVMGLLVKLDGWVGADKAAHKQVVKAAFEQANAETRMHEPGKIRVA
jgi:branched-chain amino acid transport system permease protein